MKIKRLLSLILVVTLLVGLAPGGKVTINAGVTQSGSTNDFPIVSSSTTATVWVDANEETPVKRVVNDFQADVNRVTGKTPVISNSTSMPSGPVVLIGTLENSRLINDLITSGKITSSEVAAIENQWEAYLIKVIDKNTMVILGSDNRGAIFGTYEVSEQMGVSPWYYFADVPIQKKSTVYMPQNTVITDKPDVKYRGIFINDEEKLSSWVTNKFNPENGGTGTMGAAIYARIFELILRLKGNYIWPAMHVNAFDNIEENGETLREYGVVMRKTLSAGDEWSTFKKKYAANMGIDASTLTYDYTACPEAVQAFWRDSISKHKDSEVQWLLGMRGEGDKPFVTANIDDAKYDKYGTTTQGRKAGLLSEIIADQLKVLEEEIGTENMQQSCKAILPYKEVLDLYNDEHFTLPDDMTVIWCDDNHGMVRRTPTDEDRAQSEGGMYYHASYWAPANQSYMWMSSVPLSVIGEELNKCWQTGIQNIWVLNVGDIKPIEGEMEYFIKCGWDVEKYTNDSVGFSKEWIQKNFRTSMSETTVNEVADILDTFYHHSNVRKIEQMRLDLFDQTNYNEWDKRMEMWQDLFDRAKAVADGLSTDELKAAFYELVQCKINWEYYTNKAYYYADKSNLAYDQGKMASAQNFSDLSIATEKERKQEIAYYGQILNGKWEGLIDPENYAPPVTSQLPETNPTLVLEEAEMGVITQGESMPVRKMSELKFTRYNQDGKFIDVFNKGAGTFTWKATADKSWVNLSLTEGTVSDEQRIWLTINDYDEAAGNTAIITIESGDVVKKVKVTVSDLQAGLTNCFVESDGYVSMEAEHYTSKSDAEGRIWTVRNNAGRAFGGDMMQAYDKSLSLVDESEIDASHSPRMDYDFYLTSAGEFPLEVYRLPTMNAVPGGQIRFAVSVDGGTPIVVSSTATDEGTTSNQNKQWVKNLFGQIEKHVITLPALSEGKHTLSIWMVDNFITIDKMVLYTSGNVVPSATGPEESYNSACNTEFTESIECGERTSQVLEEKNVISTWGSGAFIESSGTVGIEAEYAMENVLDSKDQITSDMSAYTVSKKAKASEVSGREPNEWRLTQSDTGLAMRVPDKGSGWSTESQFPVYSPELSYKINFTNTGTYNVWLRFRFVDNASDSIKGGIDNVSVSGQFNTTNGGFYNDKKDEKWYWQKVGSVPIDTAENHIFSLWVREDGIMVDKIYLTTGTETPDDSSFTVSSREGTSAKQSLLQIVNEYKDAFDNTTCPTGKELGCYDFVAYNTFKETLEDAYELAYGGNVTEANAASTRTKLETAKTALDDSLVLSADTKTYNAYRDFENDKVGQYPYGFDKVNLTNGATAVVNEENGNKFLTVKTSSTAGKATLILPYYGDVKNSAGEKVEIQFKARFTGTFQYANAAMIKNDAEKYSMVAAFENSNQVKEIRIQDGGTKKKVQNFESGQWYSFKLVGDFTTNTYTAYIDGVEVATNFTFRDTTGTKLTGHLLGIDGFANGQVDYDDISAKVVSDSMLSDVSEYISEKREELATYSFPVGDSAGCYDQSAYNSYISCLDDVESKITNGQVSDDDANDLIDQISECYNNMINSLNMNYNKKRSYNAYRDFENDTVGSFIPFGFETLGYDNGAAIAIAEEDGNKFLRITTGSESGHANMFLPYMGLSSVKPDEKVVAEFSARFNAELRYANAYIAKNQTDSGATTVAFDNTNGIHQVILKKSASSVIRPAEFEYDKWYHYKVVMDLEEQTYTVYMDDVEIATDYSFRTTGTTALIGHSFGIDGFTNGKLDFDNFKTYVVDESGEDDIEVSEGIEINGYQISAISKGMRTVYSVDSTIDGKEVLSSGIVYSLSQFANESELYVGSDSKYVRSYESTPNGKISISLVNFPSYSSYAMTMKFSTYSADEYNAKWRIRAYAKLSDGTYAYSDAYEYTFYGIADRIYQNDMMNSKEKHDYLYTDILSVVDSNYVERPFKYGNTVANVR